MKEYRSNFISYPAMVHPLAEEKLHIKMKYVYLIERYCKLICPDEKVVRMRVERFKHDLLGDSYDQNQDVTTATKEIMRTRFVPFRFYSYRYLFLFDCIYLLSIDDFEYARKICDMVKLTVNKRYHDKLDYLTDRMMNNPTDLSGLWMINDAMVKATADAREFGPTTEKKIVFTATMSAGKSTLINALMGRELSYTKKAACTASVADYFSSPVYHPKYNLFDNDSEQFDLSVKEVRGLSESKVTPISVSGYFNSRLNKTKIRLIDTPGVNSFLNPRHKQITQDELRSREYDVLVYVIPVENYGSEGDYYHLNYVKKNVAYRRIIFAVNMMDTCDFEDDNVEEIIENITEHLKAIGYTDPVVCPLSAKAGLRFKQALSYSALTSNEISELHAFISKYEDASYDLSCCYNVIGKDDFCDEGNRLDDINYDYLKQLYTRTGLPQFESILLEKMKEIPVCKM